MSKLSKTTRIYMICLFHFLTEEVDLLKEEVHFALNQKKIWDESYQVLIGGYFPPLFGRKKHFSDKGISL